MINLRDVLRGLLIATLAAGCAAGTPSTTAPAVTFPPSPSGASSPAYNSERIPTLAGDVMPVDAGTYRLALDVLGPAFPHVLITLPNGWNAGGAFFLNRQVNGQAVIALQFWNVDQVFGHPCKWKGTLFRPGRSVDDLVDALVDVPLREATQPIEVTLDHHSGKSLEWSVPADMIFSEWGLTDASEGCDADEDGPGFFSFTGVDGGTRFQQDAGQVDRLWILDVDGERLVIDAFHMPTATEADRAELLDVVEGIRFEVER